MITNGISTPIVLLQPWQNPHHMQLKPSQLQLLEKADIIFFYSSEIEQYIVNLQSSHNKAVFIPLATNSRLNQHSWLNPSATVGMLHNITKVLAKHYPEHISTFTQNEIKFINIIKQSANSWYQALQSATKKDKLLLTDYNALDSFLRFAGLHPTKPIFHNHGDEHSNWRNLHIATQMAADKSVACIVATHIPPAKILHKLSAKYKLPLIQVDLLGNHLTVGTNLYTELMEKLTANVIDCLT